VVIPDSPLVGSLGAFLPPAWNGLVTRDGVDCRIRILVLLVILAVAFAAMVPDFELAPAAARLVQCVRALASFAHLPKPSTPLQAASVGGVPLTIPRFGVHNSIIELTCARLC